MTMSANGFERLVNINRKGFRVLARAQSNLRAPFDDYHSADFALDCVPAVNVACKKMLEPAVQACSCFSQVMVSDAMATSLPLALKLGPSHLAGHPFEKFQRTTSCP